MPNGALLLDAAKSDRWDCRTPDLHYSTVGPQRLTKYTSSRPDALWHNFSRFGKVYKTQYSTCKYAVCVTHWSAVGVGEVGGSEPNQSMRRQRRQSSASLVVQLAVD